MKAVAILAATIVLAEAITANVERVLVLGGEVVPRGSKTYTTGIRTTPEGNSFCGGVLVTPSYVLTTAVCTSYNRVGYVSVGTHYINGTQDGEQIKVVSSQNHSSYRRK